MCRLITDVISLQIRVRILGEHRADIKVTVITSNLSSRVYYFYSLLFEEWKKVDFDKMSFILISGFLTMVRVELKKYSKTFKNALMN